MLSGLLHNIKRFLFVSKRVAKCTLPIFSNLLQCDSRVRTVNPARAHVYSRRMIRGRYISRRSEHPAPFAPNRHRRKLPHHEARPPIDCTIALNPSAMTSMRLMFLAVLLLAATACEAAPFFDAIYDAINGNGRRSYGYSGYGNGYGYNNGYNNGYSGYSGYSGHRNVEKAPRQGKSYKEICRVHFPDAIAFPGAGGIVCPY